MIDTHCHILPGADDGPKTLNGSLRMARAAVEQEGFHTIIATPHHRARQYINTARQIKRRVRALNAALRRNRIPLTVLPGQEYHLTEGYRKEHRAGRLQTLAGSSYLLVELPSRHIPDYFTSFLAYMREHRIRVVIAHPERNHSMISDPDQVIPWMKEYGALLQVTTQSLVGYFGQRAQAAALYFCQKEWAHLLATDAHNTLQRSFYYHEGSRIVEQHSGHEYLKQLQDNASAIIHGRKIQVQHPSPTWRNS